MTLLIENGRVIDPATRTDAAADVLVTDGMITAVLPRTEDGQGQNVQADRRLDASGCYVMPGFIDLHVHLRDPGFEQKETVVTGAAAAAKGGFTTIVAMPNTKPVVDRGDVVGYVHHKAENMSRVHVLQAGAITKNMEGKELAAIESMVQAGSPAISEDGKSVMNAELLRRAMRIAKELDIVVLSHCEDRNLVNGGVVNEAFGWRAVFVVLAGLVAVLGALVVFTLPETNRHKVALPGFVAVLSGYLRLVRVPVFRAYLVAGACGGTSLYAFLAVAPFLLVDRLGRSSQEVGFDCLIVVFGMVGGAVLASRLAARVPIRKAARSGNLLCIGAALSLLLVDRTGMLGVVSLIVPLFAYAVGVGLLSPNAVAGLMNVDPHAAGSASSLYGFTQMTFGALFTVAASAWPATSATPVALALLAAGLIAALALRRA